jgi:23S rRNA (pseudouridine1915-N3)-methyltransferase
VNIRIILLGKDKDRWLSEALGEFQKRLIPFCRLEILQLMDISIRQTGSSQQVIQKEGKKVLARLDEDDYVILLEERGEEKSSLEFSQFLTKLSDKKRIVFVIGGVYGTSEDLALRAQFKMSLSRMTFTHRLSRLILIEQIYRAMMISSGRSYHT